MWEQIMNTAANMGIWAMLFVTLFFIQIKDGKQRETKYQETINTLAEKFKIVTEIKETVEEIHDVVTIKQTPKEENASK